MSPEETDHKRSLTEKIGRGHLDVILVEQRETRSAVADLQGSLLNSGGLELGCRSMHRFDYLARRVVRRSSGLEWFLKLVQRC